MTEDTHALDKINRTAKWIKDGQKTSLMLYGSVGNGKTTIAKAIMSVLKQFKPQEQRFCSVTASTLIRIKYDPAFASTFTVCDHNTYLTSDILLLDELGMENETIKHYGNEDTPIQDLLFYRYEHNKPTIITSNLDNKGLLERYGERIMDRTKEQYDKVNYTNPSYR